MDLHSTFIPDDPFCDSNSESTSRLDVEGNNLSSTRCSLCGSEDIVKVLSFSFWAKLLLKRPNLIPPLHLPLPFCEKTSSSEMNIGPSLKHLRKNLSSPLPKFRIIDDSRCNCSLFICLTHQLKYQSQFQSQLETTTLFGFLFLRDWLCQLVMWLLEVYSISIFLFFTYFMEIKNCLSTSHTPNNSMQIQN